MKRVCKICNEELDISCFRKTESRFSVRKNMMIDYYRGECKQCESLYSQKQYKKKIHENPDFYKTDEHKRNVKNLHSRRYFYYKALKFRNHYNAKNIGVKELALFLWHTYHHQKGLCAITGEKLTKENMEIDHIIPRTKEFVNNDLSNLRLVSKEGNKLKSNRPDDEFKMLINNVYHHFVK